MSIEKRSYCLNGIYNSDNLMLAGIGMYGRRL